MKGTLGGMDPGILGEGLGNSHCLTGLPWVDGETLVFFSLRCPGILIFRLGCLHQADYSFLGESSQISLGYPRYPDRGALARFRTR